MAIDPYGTLTAWGENLYGQAGTNSITSYSWTQLSNGDAHSFAIRSDGTLYAWGLNTSGQLGTNDTVARQSPTQIPGSWLQVSAGASHSVGIKSDNTLYGWGFGTSGQVGDATTISKSSPVQINTSAWISVDAGTDFSLAIRSDYRLYAWGLGTSGQLGIQLAISRSTPSIFLSSTASYIQVSAGASHTLAIDNNNKLWAWGFNASGQLGDGTTTNRNGPVSLGASSWSAISAGYSHSTALTSDNRLFTWGTNTNGQLGFNMSFISIGAGASMTSIVRSDGTLWTWGLGTSGQLGDNTAVTKSSPVAVGLLTNWSKTTRPSFTNYAIDTTNKLYAWGENSTGAIGDNTVINKSSPVQIGNSSWTMVATTIGGVAGQQTAYAIRSDGGLFAWGDNSYNQANSVNTLPLSSPTQIGSSSWSIVSTGLQFAMAITSDGKLFGWGRNDTGQLGVTASTFTWTKVSSSGLHTLAIRSDNRLFAWGLNTSGQLGLGDTVPRSSPVQVASGSYTQISAGLSNSYAIRSNGSLFAWGDSSQGQLPLIVQARSSPVQVGTGIVNSAYFNGTTDYLTLSSNAAFAVGTGDFTIECWVYSTNIGTSQTIYDTRSPIDTANIGYDLYISSSGPTLRFGTNGVNYITGGTTLISNTWYHVAVSRVTSGTTSLQMFINGVQESATYTTLQNHTNNTPKIGSNGSTQFFSGFISNLRVVTGQGLYTGTFTPSTSPLTKTTVGSTGSGAAGSLSGTVVLLTCQSTSFVDNSNNSFPIIVIGNPRTDYLQIPFATSTQSYTYNSWSLVSASQTLNYVLATRSDSTLYGWGNNTNGVIGSYSLQSLSNMVVISPVQVSGGGSWTSISAGGGHSLAIKSDFKLYAWGNNTIGQTAQAGTTFSWTQIAAGINHSVAIRSDGILFTWGQNNGGQLGLSDTVYRSSPVQLGSSSWSQISAGSSHTIAIRSDSTLWAWGYNNVGQVGLGDTSNRSSPVQIGSVNTWSKVSAGSSQSFAIRSDASLYAWGLNVSFGELGDGTVINKSSPVQVGSPTSWTQIAVGSSFTGGIDTLGRLYTWGYNLQGQLGSGVTAYRSAPVQVTGNSWNFIAAGQNAMAGIDTLGKLYTWGNNAQGEFGDNSATTVTRSSPVILSGTSSWSSVTAGTQTVFAITTANALWAWGVGTSGTLGDNTIVSKSSAVAVAGGATYVKAYPSQHALAITTTTFSLQAWGLGTSGQLGDNTVVTKSSPIAVGTSIPTILSAPAIIGASSWTSVSAGGSHSTAIRTDGGLFTWGLNGNGQLGLSDTINRSSPVQVGTSSWVAVSAGSNHTLANRYGDNQLFIWGFNTQGQLGNGVTTARSSPVQVNSYSATTTNALSFNGSSQYLNGPTNTPVLTTGQFTIEAWINLTTYSNNPTIFGNQGWNTGNNIGFVLRISSAGVIQMDASAGVFNTFPNIYTGTNSITLSAWTHVAITRDSSNVIRSFINGVVDPTTATVTQSLYLTNGTTALINVGARIQDGAFQPVGFTGQMSNLRIVPGVAVYTTTFTPPVTALGATQSAGTNIAAITGIPSNGYSVLFGTANSYLTVPYNAVFDIPASTAFTFECWVYTASTNVFVMAGRNWNYGGTGPTWAFSLNSGVTPVWNIAGTGSATYVMAVSTLSGTLGQWNHYAFTRDAANLVNIWVNGVSGVSRTDSQAMTNASGAVYIGVSTNLGSAYANGFMSNMRMVNGQALYTNTFTPSTSPLTTTSQSATAAKVALLTCQSTTIIDNSTNIFTITNVNTALVSLAYSPFGTQAAILVAQGPAVTSDNSINAYTFTNVASVTQSSVTPFVAPLTGTSSSAGASASAALGSDGLLNTWGLGTSGQIGDNTIVSKSFPTRVGTLTSTIEYSPIQVGSSSWSQVSAGASHSVAIKIDNTVFAWGLNSSGQVGDSSTISRSSPVQVGTVTSALSNANAYSLSFDGTADFITAVGSGSLVRSSGSFTIEGWYYPTSSAASFRALYASSTGYATAGRLYQNNTTLTFYWGPTAGTSVTGSIGWTLNTWNHFAVTWDGTTTKVYLNGQQSISSTSPTFSGTVDLSIGESTYTPFGYISNFRIVNSIVYSSAFTPPTSPLTAISGTILLTAQNTTVVDNSTNALTLTNNGGITYSLNTPFPSAVATGALFATQISAGATHSVAIDTSSKLYAWGLNSLGQLGLNDLNSRSAPVQVGLATNYNTISAGSEHTIALDSVGTLYIWGLGSSGQLGDNTVVTKSSPVLVTSISLPNTSSPIQVGTSSYTIVSAGNNTSTAISSSNKLFVWGLGTTGQLGTGVTFSRSSPVQISTNSYNLVNAGGTHTTFVPNYSPQILLATGLGTSGQIGDLNTISRSSPTQIGASITTFNNPVTVSTGNYSSYYVSSPTQVGTSSWTAVSAGGTHTLAIRNNNTLYAWGYNANGQLGGSDTINRSSPVQVGTSSWSQVSAGDLHNMILKSDGTINTFGLNTFGQLGDGT
jgi:alpha-tubulin suppressor-like RCC1 family protein